MDSAFGVMKNTLEASIFKRFPQFLYETFN